MGYIYKLTNVITNKDYIGQTTRTPEIRLKEHIEESKRTRCKGRKIYKSINEHGIENFKLTTVEECENSELEDREIYYVALYDTCRNGYNETFGGLGKPFVDSIIKKDIIETYTKYNISLKEMSGKIGLSRDTIRGVLVENNTEIIREYEQRTDSVQIERDNITIDFDSIRDCAIWISNNLNTKATYGRIRKQVIRVLDGKRKSYLGYKYNKIA